MKTKDYDPNRKWIIEVTEQQLCDIIEDVEDIHRFLAGQTELFNATSYVSPRKNMLELRDKLIDLYSLVTPELSRYAAYDWRAGGCPNEPQAEKIKRGYAIYRNLRHCYLKHCGIDKMNVYYRETLTCGVPLAICYPKPNDKEEQDEQRN